MAQGDLSSHSLFPATADQVTESRKRTYAQWNGGRTLEEYLRRDDILDEFENSVDHKLTTWVLAPREDPTTLDFKCSCETYRRLVVVSKPASDSSGRVVEDTIAYAVASVFTPPIYRKRGYASHMMGLLHWVLAHRQFLPDEFPQEWGLPPVVPDWVGDGQLSILYTDVGPDFYHRCGPNGGQKSGWGVTVALHTLWDVDPSSNLAIESSTDGLECIWLGADECIPIWAKDEAPMRDDVQKLAPGDATAFAFLPNDGTGIWGVHKTVLFTPDLKPYLPSDTWGVWLQGRQTEALTYATWIYDIRTPPHTLVVSRIRATTSTFGPLFAKILEAARKQKITKIEIWNLPKELEAAAEALKGVTAPRPKTLPSIKWYGGDSSTKVVWMFNERYAWC